MKLLSISEFSNCKNPLTARAAFYLDSFLESVGDKYGYAVSSMPYSSSVENAVLNIHFVDYKTKTIASFFLMEDGSIVKVKKISHSNTGRKIFNDDIQILDEIQTTYVLEDSPCGVVEGFLAACESEEGFENIACQSIMIIEDAIANV